MGKELYDKQDINILINKDNYISERDLKKLLQMVRSIKYGSISLIIQDGVIVQIESNEKIRLR